MARGVSGRRITSGLALSSPPLTCAGSQIATNPDDQGSAAQRSQGEVRPDIEGHGAPPRSHWAPQPKRAPYSVLAQAAVAGSTQRLTRDLLNGGRAASVFEDEALTPEVTGSRLTAAPHWRRRHDLPQLDEQRERRRDGRAPRPHGASRRRALEEHLAPVARPERRL